MSVDRLTRVLEAYNAGAITDGVVVLDILIAAGYGDAAQTFASLPPEFQARVRRKVAEVPCPADEFRIIEGYCGSNPEAYGIDLHQREAIAHRGLVALHRATRGTPGEGYAAGSTSALD